MIAVAVCEANADDAAAVAAAAAADDDHENVGAAAAAATTYTRMIYGAFFFVRRSRACRTGAPLYGKYAKRIKMKWIQTH